MARRRTFRIGAVCVLMLLGATGAWAAAKLPENLAARATVSASSEYSNQYLAKFAVDGKVPPAGSQADLGKAWAVQGKTAADKAEFTLGWKQPVTVAEIVYYGRTAWQREENFKDYAVHLDGSETPVVKGRLKPGHGPQRIRLPTPARVRRVALKFLSSYGGSNPGASEIGVYASPPPEKALGALRGPNEPPPAPVTDLPDLARRLKAGDLGFTKILAVERHRVTSSHVYTYHCEGQRDGGGLYVCDVTTGDLKQLVDASEGQILDCDVSWDGREILFSMRRGTYYQVYRVGADGTDLVQLTRGDVYNFNACWLPDGGIAFLSTRAPQFAYCWTSPVGVLYRMGRDGKNVRRLSANYLNDFTPAVLSDGRIIYGRWEYVDRPAIPIQGLWTINADGTMLAQYYGNRVLGPATFIDPQPVPGSGAVLCTMTGHNGSCGGAVGVIDPIYGDNTQAAIRNLTPEINHGRVEVSNNGPRSGPYQTPYPVDETYFLVSYKGHVLVRDYAGTGQATVLASRGIGWRNARPLRPRWRPPVRSSTVPDEPAAEEEGRWATVYLQDVHRGLGLNVAPGVVRQVVVVQEIEKSRKADVRHRAFGFQFPVVSCGATYSPKKVWGTADVAEDGSASFRVPAGVPIYFMALDEHGRAVQRMRSFTHFMPGEVQGCIGCHEPRSESPRVARLQTTARPPQPLRPPEWGRRGFDYAGIVQPVLDRHCTRCHKPPDPPKGVDLTGDATDFFSVSYEVLAREKFDRGWGGRGYTRSISTYNGAERNILEITPKVWGSPASPLADRILAGHPDADGRPRVDLSEAERRRIFAWIDLNVPYYGTSLARDYERQGCRRLYPADLDKVLADVAGRRCADCHNGGKVPRKEWVRIARPQYNAFLLAPLARPAGGTGACGRVVFKDTSDPDYRAVLETFEALRQTLRQQPRVDLAGAVPDDRVNRSKI